MESNDDKLHAMQVGIIVTNIETKRKNWSELLGVPEPRIVFLKSDLFSGIEYKGSPTDANAKLVYFDLGHFQIELIEPIGGPSAWADFLEEVGEGIHHIAFRLPEEKTEAMEVLGSKEMPVTFGGDFKGGSFSYVESTKQLGAILELLEFTESEED